MKTVCEAIETGSCLELTYGGVQRIVEVHAFGYLANEEPAICAWQRPGLAPEGWQVIRLDQTRDIDISGYMSEAPRPGYDREHFMFERVVCEVDAAATTGKQS